MAKLSDMTLAPLVALLGFMTLNKPVLAINAASAATVKTTNAVNYTSNGVSLSKAALSAQSIAVTHTMNGTVAGGAYVQPASTTVYYTLGVDNAGAITVSQGSYAGQNNSVVQAGVSAVGTGAVPDVPAGVTPFGVVKVVTNGSTTFTAGTTALDAAGVTATYFDVAVLPSGAL